MGRCGEPSLRSGGGRVDATGKWLVGAKGEYPISRNASHVARIRRRSGRFLRDPRWRLAPQRVGALESVRLDLVEAELEVPALVVERDDLGGGIGHRIEQRGEERLGAEASSSIGDRPHAQRGWQEPRLRQPQLRVPGAAG